MSAATVAIQAQAPVTEASLTTLDQITPGCGGVVVAITGAPAVRRRLFEMGLCTGIVITVLRRAPLGDPIELSVRGYLLSLRRDQAHMVQISRTGTNP